MIKNINEILSIFKAEFLDTLENKMYELCDCSFIFMYDEYADKLVLISSEGFKLVINKGDASFTLPDCSEYYFNEDCWNEFCQWCSEHWKESKEDNYQAPESKSITEYINSDIKYIAFLAMLEEDLANADNSGIWFGRRTAEYELESMENIKSEYDFLHENSILAKYVDCGLRMGNLATKFLHRIETEPDVVEAFLNKNYGTKEVKEAACIYWEENIFAS